LNHHCIIIAPSWLSPKPNIGIDINLRCPPAPSCGAEETAARLEAEQADRDERRAQHADLMEARGEETKAQHAECGEHATYQK